MFVNLIYLQKKIINYNKIKKLIVNRPLAGLEPAIPNLGGWCLIH